VEAFHQTVANFYNCAGDLYRQQQQFAKAIEFYEKAIHLQPEYAPTYLGLGAAYDESDRLGQAIAAYQQALQLQPDDAVTLSQLGRSLKHQGRIQEAIDCWRRALRHNPNHASVNLNLLTSLHYSPDCEPSKIYAEYQQWAERHATPLAQLIKPFRNDRNPERRLRIGYVSGDFYSHAVACFLEPLLAAHDHSDFEIICYASNQNRDTTTQQLQAYADRWREIYTLDDEQLADLIRQDEIDILVDLSGHTKNNRLSVFARKPAPVQVTYLGYPNTTGLNTINYRLTDAWADPVGQTEHLHTEELVRLPYGFLCYQLPADSPEVSPLPALTSQPITFGSFNKLAKVNPEVIGNWARILKAVPDSRLLLKSQSLADPGTRNYVQERFQQHGIKPDRLELIGWIPNRNQHLTLYGEVDIALDTFPYNGTTTTCEAMWMGVPVITLAGQTHVSRVGVSLLSSVGLEELIADSAEDYIQKAIALANNLERLQELRATLRERMQATPLTNAKLITQSLEDAYRTMWQHWCSQEESKVIQLQPDSAKTYFETGNAFKKQGQLSEAIESYQQALKLKPDYVEALNNLANVFYEQGKLAEAIQSYQRALHLKPEYALAHSNLGNVLKDQGKLTEAIQSYQQALQLNPHFSQKVRSPAPEALQDKDLNRAIASK
jgi:predicted O-linked N-acetylglucosamine transferase (SPINDLY family)